MEDAELQFTLTSKAASVPVKQSFALHFYFYTQIGTNCEFSIATDSLYASFVSPMWPSLPQIISSLFKNLLYAIFCCCFFLSSTHFFFLTVPSVYAVTPEAVGLRWRRVGTPHWLCRWAFSESGHHWGQVEKERQRGMIISISTSQ